jgi:hypothetical protein
MIRNITKNTVLAKQCRVCDTWLSRAVGLMFAKKLTPTVLALGRERDASIHTFFVRHFLDVLFLDDQWEVVEMVRGLEPNRVYRPKRKAMFVVELPEGAIQRSRTALGDVINFK